MSIGRGEQIERGLDHLLADGKPIRYSYKKEKRLKAKRERSRAKHNPECPPEYGVYSGYVW